MSSLRLVESAGTIVDRFGDDGPSAGDIRVWGPNPLFDETNTTDTGAVTQGSCIGINVNFDCLVNETMIFPDGSTLEIQGLQPGGSVPSVRTIVGGSGQYLGATGTVAVAPSDDQALWTKTIGLAGCASSDRHVGPRFTIHLPATPGPDQATRSLGGSERESLPDSPG